MNLAKKTINVGKGIMNLDENFIKTPIVTHRDAICDFLETSGLVVAKCR